MIWKDVDPLDQLISALVDIIKLMNDLPREYQLMALKKLIKLYGEDRCKE